MGEPPNLTMCGLRCVVQDEVGEHFILTGVSYLILEYVPLPTRYSAQRIS
jgi:hypothetical protein